MRSFQRADTLDPVPGGIVATLRRIDLAAGGEARHVDQLPQLLDALREQARIESITASSAIEGVIVAEGRAPALATAAPPRFRNRSEAEFATLNDLGIDSAKLGLTTRLLRRIENPVVGTDVGDVITGTSRRDLLIGLHGPDRFSFQNLGDAAGVGRNRDLIADFAGKRGDRIDLRRIDANTTRAGNQAFRFVGKRGFSGTAGELRYRGGVLRGDVNGNGSAELEIGLLGAPALRPDHIWL